MSKSNIQALDHMDQTKLAHTISFLKNEIKYGLNKVNEEKNSTVNNNFCKNESTGLFYSFLKGSKDEKELYRVMPVDGSEKIFFDSKDEYETWNRKNRNRLKTYNHMCIQGVC